MRRIHGDRQIGQVVVLDNIIFKEDDPLSEYEQPQMFIIVRVDKVENRPYVIKDNSGRKTTAEKWYLCDADEWVKSQREKAEKRREEEKIILTDLKSKLDILTSILTKQGYKIVTEKQAEEIGLA